MIYNEALYDLEDCVDLVTEEILKTNLVCDYFNHYTNMTREKEVDVIVTDFLRTKKEFTEIEEYGQYAPDFKEKRRALRKAKRAVDTNELIAEFKYSETSLQNMLDYMCLDIAQTISETIKVDAGNPFFEFAKRGCGGNCHVN
ncbi:YlbF family regulator [Vagococcus jeotgali]|uniref:YlbF family regulator n=1 Tax=Vagococcus jeotgali TaxID=3109030 RepID=UPI002DD9E20A|nr:YlbF family regulator [Vagococcus sp. B2T-5]